jgi:rfaE bifunctional protein nucleotidyltransferase chain/domain
MIKKKKNVDVEKFISSGQLIKDTDIKQLSADFKKAGYKVALTQGVWDLIHIGHARYLQKAKKLGDVLIVAVDTDEVVRHRKGPNRPIVPEEERVQMISHLKSVDVIVMKKSKTDHGKLIRLIKPDVFVVSKTTASANAEKKFIEEIEEEHKNFCKKIINLNAQATTSTTARVRTLTISGMEELAEELHKMIDKFLHNKKS